MVQQTAYVCNGVSASDAGEAPEAAADAAEDGSTIVRYFHTIAIDGVNDFAANETFATTTTGHTGYLAWDDTYLYVGVDGPDVGSGFSSNWVVVYLGGPAGTTTGVTYNTQTPTLAFPAQYHVRWKTDNTFTDALT